MKITLDALMFWNWEFPRYW